MACSRLNPFHSSLEPPSEFAVDAARHLRGIHALEWIVELHVMIAEQVLTDYTHVHGFRDSPAQLRIHAGISGNLRIREAIYKVRGGIPGKTMEHFDVRPKLGLINRIRALNVGDTCRVLAVPSGVKMHFQKSVSGAERPSIRDFPARK